MQSTGNEDRQKANRTHLHVLTMDCNHRPDKRIPALVTVIWESLPGEVSVRHEDERVCTLAHNCRLGAKEAGITTIWLQETDRQVTSAQAPTPDYHFS